MSPRKVPLNHPEIGINYPLQKSLSPIVGTGPDAQTKTITCLGEGRQGQKVGVFYIF